MNKYIKPPYSISSYISIAHHAAKSSPIRRGKVAAIVYNLVNRHFSRDFYLMAVNYPIYGLKNKFTIHAEESCILKAAKKGISLSGASIVIVRYKPSTGGFGESKPCERCQMLLDNVGIYNLWYYDGKEWVND